MNKKYPLLAAALLGAAAVNAANPFLPLWEFIPDGEPYVFEDPDHPGKMRVYLYGSHDTRSSSYCGRDQVVWSVDVEDLKHWRCDGVSFRSLNDANGKPLLKMNDGDVLFAPDVTVTKDANGKKTYWLYPNTQAWGRGGQIAKSDRPDGPFTVCNWTHGRPRECYGILGFDPAGFTDDDGRVYGYWGFQESYGAELDPKTMCTVKPDTEIVKDMISNKNQPGVFRFFEASSMRKIKDKYVFIYSRWTAKGDHGLGETNYTLAYAYSASPLGPFTYGGTLIDGRARETRPDGSVVHTATPSGNTHGSLCEINGRWWVFYHRQSGDNEFSRQAMVAPVEVSVEEGKGGRVVITEGEYNSEGFEIGGLDPFEVHAAGIACYYTGARPSRQSYPVVYYPGPYFRPFRGDYYEKKDPYAEDINRSDAIHITSGSTLGYKCFNFDAFNGRDTAELELKYLPQGIEGGIEIWAKRPNDAEGGVKLGEAKIAADRDEKEKTLNVKLAGLKPLAGKVAVFFNFSSQVSDVSICELKNFKFK